MSSREAVAISSVGPNEMLVRFRHYRAGEVVRESHASHPDHRFVKIPFDWEALDEVMQRCAREFGAR